MSIRGSSSDPDRGVLNRDTIHSDFGDVVTGGMLPDLALNPERGMTLNLDTIHSSLDDITPRELPPGVELNLGRDKSLQATWQAKVAPKTILPEMDGTSAAELMRRWELRSSRAKLRSTNPELDDDDDNWKFVPYAGAVLVFFTWILQRWTQRVANGKVAALKQL